jgi:hypothetical protein
MTTCDCGHLLTAHQTGEGPWTGFCGGTVGSMEDGDAIASCLAGGLAATDPCACESPTVDGYNAPPATRTELPERVTATLADDGPDGVRVYRLADLRGYTHHYVTIRIGHGHRGDRYAVSTHGRDGWAPLCEGPLAFAAPYPYDAAILRAVAILFGMEDHG